MGVGLGVVLLAERESTLDQDGLISHIPPLEGQGLAWPEPCVGEDTDQRGVARADHGAEREELRRLRPRLGRSCEPRPDRQRRSGHALCRAEPAVCGRAEYCWSRDQAEPIRQMTVSLPTTRFVLLRSGSVRGVAPRSANPWSTGSGGYALARAG